MFEFPTGFLWGTATAAHQVEGGNWNNDWWAWEHAPDTPCVEPSGDAVDHWHRFPADIEPVVKPVVTYHHFTTPRWLADQGGWDADVTSDRFLRYAERLIASMPASSTRTGAPFP